MFFSEDCPKNAAMEPRPTSRSPRRDGWKEKPDLLGNLTSLASAFTSNWEWNGPEALFTASPHNND
jgi:hypothetical protein